MRLGGHGSGAVFAILTFLSVACGSPLRAAMDIEDQGPLLQTGRYALRVSNVGVLGNPWFDIGRSFDPSFEFPRGSGNELLGRAELWVASTRPDGRRRVSGGPMYEWRPTLAAADTVRGVRAGVPGALWSVDDDGDGAVDEDPFNARDDDGDGRIDEDFDLPAQQLLVARYTDDQPEAVSFGYSNGEAHVPMGLSVQQEVLGWGAGIAQDIAVVRFVITNHSSDLLTDLRLGLYVDLDARSAADRGGHLDDRIHRVPYRLVIPEGNVIISAAQDGKFRKTCFTDVEGQAVAISDGRTPETLPVGAVVPLSHTTDPLALLTIDLLPGVRAAREAAQAPARDHTFQTYLYAQGLPPGQGGPPVLDEQRVAAMEGRFNGVEEDGIARDHAVLLSCGPFPRLRPGTSVEFSVALVAATTIDSIAPLAQTARLLEHGTHVDAIADTPSDRWYEGTSGINGHEICFEPPAGIEFTYDPHCPYKFFRDPLLVPDPDAQGPDEAFEVVYRPGACVWSDLDCEACTGHDGTDTRRRWSLSSLTPSSPSLRVTPGDGTVLLEWDDAPEVALAAGLVGDAGMTFEGYAVYRLDDWKRVSRLPTDDRWQRIAIYRADTTRAGGIRLGSITDETLAPIDHVSGFPRHPVGRYRAEDRGLHVGADYHYVVTSLLRMHAPYDTLPASRAERESPFVPEFSERVTPQAASRDGSPRAWVVPNPYRGSAEWERPAVAGDPLTRHLDFLGLPRERCTIRIYTVAGDLVELIEHDGTRGDGQAAWDLVSRNGQDVSSGVYLFTIEAPSGTQVGRFVVIR